MRLCYLTCLLICLSFNISSHEGKHFEFKECRAEADPLKPIPTRQVPPMYPRKALEMAIESNVLLEFTVNEKGRVEDPQVIWLDQTSSKSNKDLFSRSAINTVKKFKYMPGKTTSGEPISTDGVKVIIYKKICKKEEKDNCKVIKYDTTLAQKVKLAILKKAANIKESERTEIDYSETGSGRQEPSKY